MKNWLNQTPGGTSPVLWHKTRPALQTLTGQSSFVLQEVKRQKYTLPVRFTWALFYTFFHFKTLAVTFLNWNWEISRKTYRNCEIQRLDSCSSYHPGGFCEPGKSTKTIPPTPLHSRKLSGILEPGRQQKSHSSRMNPLQRSGTVLSSRCFSQHVHSHHVAPLFHSPRQESWGLPHPQHQCGIPFLQISSTQKTLQVKGPC